MKRSSRWIAKSFDRLKQSAKRLEIFTELFGEALMAGVQELQAKIDELATAVSEDEAGDAALVDQLNVVIADLKAQVAAGTPLDTQPFIDELEAIKASLQPAAPPV